MAESTTLVAVEEYLATTYKPACDYLDGVLRPKSMPTRKHAMVQYRAAELINQRFVGFEAAPELTLRIRADRFLVPDVAVQARASLQEPYPTEPIHLCVEVLSPDDRMSDAVAKCEEYHAWGVPFAWILDPESERAWGSIRGQRLHEIPVGGTLTAGPIAIPVEDVFALIRT